MRTPNETVNHKKFCDEHANSAATNSPKHACGTAGFPAASKGQPVAQHRFRHMRLKRAHTHGPSNRVVWSRAPHAGGHLHAQHREGRCSRELGASRAAHAVVVDGLDSIRAYAHSGPGRSVRGAASSAYNPKTSEITTVMHGSPGKRRVIGTLAYVPRADTN